MGRIADSPARKLSNLRRPGRYVTRASSLERTRAMESIRLHTAQSYLRWTPYLYSDLMAPHVCVSTGVSASHSASPGSASLAIPPWVHTQK